MADGTPRVILHVDMDAFFAAVELKERPELAGQPVIVGGRGDPQRRGVVSTATYEARQFGVHSGMALRTAARLCPAAVFLPVNMAAYRAASAEVFAVLAGLTRRIQAVGLDEAYLDLSGHGGAAEDHARHLKERIHARTGLTASVGIAGNRLLAKIASDLEKPDGLVRLTAEDVPARVWPLPVRTLHGVGPRTAERLEPLGVTTVGDLAALDPSRLETRFSPNHAAALQAAARGEDHRPVVSERVRKSIGRERTFQVDCRSSGRLAAETATMIDDVHTRLTAAGLLARTVTVKIRYRDFVTRTRAVSLPRPSDDATLLATAAREALFAHTLHRAVRLLGVQLSQLSPRQPPTDAA